MMNCNECRDHIIDYLYEELDDEQRRAFELSLEDCEACRQELQQARATLGAFKTLPPIDMPTERREAILEAAQNAVSHEGAGAESSKSADVIPLYKRPVFSVALAAILTGVVVSALLLYRPASQDSEVEYEQVAAQSADSAEQEEPVAMAILRAEDEESTTSQDRRSARAASEASAPQRELEPEALGAMARGGSQSEDREGGGGSTGNTQGSASGYGAGATATRDADEAAPEAAAGQEPAPTRSERTARSAARPTSPTDGERQRVAAQRSEGPPGVFGEDALFDDDQAPAEAAEAARPEIALAENDDLSGDAEESETGAEGTSGDEATLRDRADDAYREGRYADAQSLYEALHTQESGASAEYALYRAALSASRAGRSGEAARLADAYIARYPDGRYAGEMRPLRP